LASQPSSALVTATSNHRSQREFLGLLGKHLRVHFLSGQALTLGVIFQELMYLLVVGDLFLLDHFLSEIKLTLGIIFRELMYLLVMGILLTRDRQQKDVNSSKEVRRQEQKRV
jgi:hypothetical protein